MVHPETAKLKNKRSDLVEGETEPFRVARRRFVLLSLRREGEKLNILAAIDKKRGAFWREDVVMTALMIRCVQAYSNLQIYDIWNLMYASDHIGKKKINEGFTKCEKGKKIHKIVAAGIRAQVSTATTWNSNH